MNFLGKEWYHQLLGLLIVGFYIVLVHEGKAPADGFCILATGIIKDIFALMKTNADNSVSEPTKPIVAPIAEVKP